MVLKIESAEKFNQEINGVSQSEIFCVWETGRAKCPPALKIIYRACPEKITRLFSLPRPELEFANLENRILL